MDKVSNVTVNAVALALALAGLAGNLLPYGELAEDPLRNPGDVLTPRLDMLLLP